MAGLFILESFIDKSIAVVVLVVTDLFGQVALFPLSVSPTSLLAVTRGYRGSWPCYGATFDQIRGVFRAGAGLSIGVALGNPWLYGLAGKSRGAVCGGLAWGTAKGGSSHIHANGPVEDAILIGCARLTKSHIGWDALGVPQEGEPRFTGHQNT